jgi:hypothetical protein
VIVESENDIFNQDFSHNLHKRCLKKWFESQSDCPVCHQTLTADLFEKYPISAYNKAGFSEAI